MILFPDWGTQTAESRGDALPLYTEWAVDWDKGTFALRSGQPYTVTGNDALKLWVRCALHPETVRFLYTAHTAEYGNQLAERMAEQSGEDIRESLLRREIRETLLVSPYITAVDDFAFIRKGSRLTVCFRVKTVYGEFTTESEVLTA